MKRPETRLFQLLLLAACFSLPLSAVADDQLDRFEEISERSHVIMMDMMIREYTKMGADGDDLRAAIPDGTWDDAYRDAGQCTLDKYRAIIGSSGVDDMLDEMDDIFISLDDGSATFESMEELSELNSIEGISTEQQMSITRECGIIELSMQRMRESGFMDVLQSQVIEQQ